MAKVSIIMPVYNGEKYLKEAIESILVQTFSDFIFIIINDCSTDGSIEIIKSYRDPRIKILANKKNFGLSASLNIGLKNSNTKYVARMDQDDISLPNRIEKQVNFMEANPAIGVCGAYIKIFNENYSRIKKFPLKYNDIKVYLLFNSPFAHPTVMIRKKILSDHNLKYNTEYDGAEDYDLWERISRVAKLENIPEVLLSYRAHQNQLSRIAFDKKNKIDSIRNRQFARLGIKKNNFKELLKANKKYCLYSHKSLRKKIYSIYYSSLKINIKNFIKTFKKWIIC